MFIYDKNYKLSFVPNENDPEAPEAIFTDGEVDNYYYMKFLKQCLDLLTNKINKMCYNQKSFEVGDSVIITNSSRAIIDNPEILTDVNGQDLRSFYPYRVYPLDDLTYGVIIKKDSINGSNLVIVRESNDRVWIMNEDGIKHDD